MRILKKSVSILLSVLMVVSLLTVIPFAAGAESAVPELTDGAYVPNQVVVLFKDSAIDTETTPGKGELEPLGADFGDMMDASSSETEAFSAADEEVDILSKSLGGDFVLEDTLVFDEPETEGGKNAAPLGALGGASFSEGLTVALVSSDRYDTATLIQKLSGNKNVAKVEPNYISYSTALDDYSLNDEYSSYLYHVNSPAAENKGGDSVDDRGADAETALSTNAASGWKKVTDTEKEVVVAVIDSGVLDTHEDLKDVMWTNPGDIGLKGKHGYNFANNNTKSAQDESGHGTHCAGVIAAQANNLKGVAGIASAANVKIMALKTMSGAFGTSTAYANYGAFNYIHKAVRGGVNVVAVNNSWGGLNQSDIFDLVINQLGEDGVISYIAAGNDGENNDVVMVNPSNTSSDYAVSVGAADITGKAAAFSNYGKTSVDIFGTGLNILSTVAYKNYYPELYSADIFNATTEYYGEFNADTKVENGRITPSTGSKADESVKSFGEICFVKQKLSEDEETEIADSAKLELSVEQGRHFTSGNPYRLKVTVKDAQPGEEYFIYFPYEKNAMTTGDDNTFFSVSGESIAEANGCSAVFYCGEVSKGEDGRYALTGRQNEFVPGGVRFCSTEASNNYVQRHSTNISDYVESGLSSKIVGLLSAEDAGDRELGFGLYVSADSEGSHDLSLYLDTLAISKPDIELERNNSYDVMSGTSMACPSVCGGGALIAALNPRQEDESGADYAKRIRAKLLSCVTRTDEFKDLCSTGGYLDLSKLDAAIPSISDAVCDVDAETITLKGENLFEGSSVAYRSLCDDDAQAQVLPDGMTTECSADGRELVIKNARSLFSTYTEFTVTSAEGVSGTGKFFLVKGQRALVPVSSEMKEARTVFIQKEGNLESETEELVPPVLLTDKNGENLFGYNHGTSEISKFDGKKFNTLLGSDLKGSLTKYLEQQGVDCYTFYNGYRIYYVKTDLPANENGVVYMLTQAMPTDEFDSDDDDDNGEENNDEDNNDEDNNDEDNNDEENNGEEEYNDDEEPIPDDHTWYLASFDLNDADPHWSFEEIDQIPNDVDYTEYSKTVNVCACGGKLYLIGSAAGHFDEPLDSLLMYSLDLKTKKWTEEPELPYYSIGMDFVASNGKLYAMYGYLSDSSLSTKERLCSSVFCFDGKKWEQKNDRELIGRVYSSHSEMVRREAVTSVRNGLVFVGTSADGGGNVFLYNTDTEQIVPMYYTTSDSLSDNYGACSSCVTTLDGIYYIRLIRDDYKQGWELSLLPESSGAYETPYFTPILGDVDGDGEVTVADVTRIQKYLAGYEMPYGFNLEAADADGDGNVTVADATRIQRFLAGMPSSFGIGEPVGQTDPLSLWTQTAPLKAELTDYMKAITDVNSPDYIPVENRIAVFDMDGTLCCETDPGYFDHKLLYHRVMEDPDYKDKASDFEKEVCAEIETYFETGVYPKGLDVRHGTAVATAFKGMTMAEFEAYVKAYRDTPMNSYTNMTNGQAFYKPMLQVVDFLQANGFKVYIVSGTDRFITRGLADGMINIPLAQMIGSDESLVATGQGDADGLNYTFTHDDELITGGEFIIKNLKMNKVTVIEQEIGLQPVLCFGNSSGDAAMANYTITNNKYRSGAFLLCCDDLERENGNLKKANDMRASCEKNGWTAVSMKDDWTTIYGDGVEKK